MGVKEFLKKKAATNQDIDAIIDGSYAEEEKTGYSQHQTRILTIS